PAISRSNFWHHTQHFCSNITSSAAWEGAKSKTRKSGASNRIKDEIASAVAERQQVIERAQLDQQAVQQVAVARLGGLRHLGEARERAIDQAAEFRMAADRRRRHAVAALQR